MLRKIILSFLELGYIPTLKKLILKNVRKIMKRKGRRIMVMRIMRRRRFDFGKQRIYFDSISKFFVLFCVPSKSG